jgi:hypothetical protein
VLALFVVSDIFNQSVGAYHYNQFGAAVGGPLVIAHLLHADRAWYVFGYYEGIRFNQAAEYTANVPTQAELSGNFAGQQPIYDPYTSVVAADSSLIARSVYTNNQIPSSELNSGAAAVSDAAKLLGAAPADPDGRAHYVLARLYRQLGRIEDMKRALTYFQNHHQPAAAAP